jgi:4-hydroxy-tetrahydrodipicolinate reductase
MKVGVAGLGPIGVEVVKAIVEQPGLELAAAVDVAPALGGRLLGELVPGAPSDLRISPLLGETLAGRGIVAVALCTRSKVAEVAPAISEIVAAGAHVVTTCEELAAPSESSVVKQLHRAAQKAAVTVLATGINPGFVMDRWPLQLAGMCVRVRGVAVERVVDAGQRRAPLRHKVGHGLTVEEFHAGIAAGQLGHVGLPASATLIARGLGTTLAHVGEKVEPVLGPDGRVLGVRQHLRAGTADGRPIELRLEMYVGAPDPHDRVTLDADPPIDARIHGGIQGDRATVAAVLEGLRRVPTRAPRGVVSVIDVY